MLVKNGLKILAGAWLLAAGVAAADDKFPIKPIRMLVPFSAGSTTDFFARMLGQKLTESWGSWPKSGCGGVFRAGSFAKNFRDHENHDGPEEPAAEQEVEHRKAGGGDGEREHGEIVHGGECGQFISRIFWGRESARRRLGRRRSR